MTVSSHDRISTGAGPCIRPSVYGCGSVYLLVDSPQVIISDNLSFLGGKSENEAFRSVSGVFLLKNQLKGPNKALENLGFGRDTLRRPPEAFQSQQTAHLTPIQPHFQTRVTLARCTYIGLNQRRANALHM